MTSVAAIWSKIKESGGTAKVVGTDIRLSVPSGVLSDRDKAILREHKREFLEIMQRHLVKGYCSWCQSSADLVVGASGLWCPDCERLAWRLEGPSMVRGDAETVGFESLPPAHECPKCGGIVFRWDAHGVRHCVVCDPGQSDRLTALAKLLRERAMYREW